MNLNCLDARRLIQAEPRSRDRALLAHLDACAECRGVAKRSRALDERLHAALATTAPEGLVERIQLSHDRGRAIRAINRRRFAVGAVATLAVGTAVALLARRKPIDPGELAIAHVMHEPAARIVERSIDSIVLRNALSEQGVALTGRMGRVTFRAPCPVPGGVGEHIVIRAEEGTISLIMDPRQSVDEPEQVRARDGLVAVVIRCTRGHVSVVAASREQALAFAARLRPVNG